MLALFGAGGLALCIGVSAWLGAFDRRADVMVAGNGTREIDVNAAIAAEEAGPYRLWGGEEGRASEVVYPDRAACESAREIETAALERRHAAASRAAGQGAGSMWMIMPSCNPDYSMPGRATRP